MEYLSERTREGRLIHSTPERRARAIVSKRLRGGRVKRGKKGVPRFPSRLEAEFMNKRIGDCLPRH